MKKPSLLVIFLTVFIDLIGFGIVLPLLPKYSERFGAEGFRIGLIISSFSVMQFIFAPLWGRLSDRIGRRPVLLLSNFGSAASYALFALSAYVEANQALWILLLSRVFAGICGANLSVASAYIADITSRENRSKSMGLIGMAFGLGFILGPALGALSAAKFGLAGPGWVASALCLGNFLLGCAILKESKQPNSEHVPQRPRLAQWSQAFTHPKLAALITIYFLATFCFTCFESTLPLLVGSSSLHPDDIKAPIVLANKLVESKEPLAKDILDHFDPGALAKLKAEVAAARANAVAETLEEELNRQSRQRALLIPTGVTLREQTLKLSKDKLEGGGLAHLNRMLLEDAYPQEIARSKVYYDEKHVGYLFAYCGLIAAFIQGGAIGRLIKKFGDQRLIAGSLIVVAISLVIIPYVVAVGGLLLALGLFATGSGINRAPTMGQISLNCPPEEQGATLGIAQSVGTLARIVGPVFATTLFYIHKPAPYLVCAAVAAIAGLLAWQLLCRST